MNRQGSLPALEKSNVSKTEYRILRAKVLKILDHNFKKNQNSRLNKSGNELESNNNRPQLKTLDLLKMIKNHDTNAINKTLNETFDAEARSSINNGINNSINANEDLCVKNLCKFITDEELEIICEDPIYFLGRQEYQRNPKLTDYQEWAKQLELAKERRKKEKKWKETQEALKATFSQSPRNDYFERLSISNHQELYNSEPKDRIRIKNLFIESKAKNLKEKHEEKQDRARVRRDEQEEIKELILRDQTMTSMRKHNSVEQRLTQKKEKIRQLILESQQGRDLAHKKFNKWKVFLREEKANQHELKKINFQIENIVKKKIIEQQRTIEMYKKIEKARISGSYKINKSGFTTKTGSNFLSKDITLEDINSLT